MNFSDLAFNPLCRMNEIKRYSSVHQETEETLAEHVTEVCAMSYLISQELIKRGEDIDIEKLLVKCLVHDVDEVITGDITRNTKYANDEVHQSLEKVAEEAVNLISSYAGINFTKEWSEAKTEKEGRILKIVDMLVVVKKAMTEVVLRNNLSFLKVTVELRSHLKSTLKNIGLLEEYFNESAVKFLTSLVTQAFDEVEQIYTTYKNVIDKYCLKENVINGK